MNIIRNLTAFLVFGLLPTITLAEDSNLVSSFNHLLELLEDDSVTHQTQRAEQIVLIPVAKAPIDSTMLIRWAQNDGVVHFVQTMELKVPPERFAAVCEAAQRINHAISVPGLGIDPDAKVLYFRMSPTTAADGGLTRQMIRTCFRHTLNQAAALHGIMQEVIEERVAPENVVDAFNKAASEATIVPPGRYEVNLEEEIWALTFEDDGTVHLFRGDEQVVESSSMTEGDQITFIDRSGAFKVSDPGVYQWQHDDGKLQFQLVRDSSQGREKILTSAVWKNTPAKE